MRLDRGFAYLLAVIDWYSRQVLSWRISNSMEAAFCVDCLEDALREHGKPEVFNGDQGGQFTSNDFTGVLKREAIATVKADCGRAYDNIFVERLWRSVKREDAYLNGYATMDDLLIGLTKYQAKERLPVALRSSGTAFEEVKIESESAIPIANTGTVPSCCEKSSET